MDDGGSEYVSRVRWRFLLAVISVGTILFGTVTLLLDAVVEYARDEIGMSPYLQPPVVMTIEESGMQPDWLLMAVALAVFALSLVLILELAEREPLRDNPFIGVEEVEDDEE